MNIMLRQGAINGSLASLLVMSRLGVDNISTYQIRSYEILILKETTF